MTGERGPTGDHGQKGDKGATGAAGVDASPNRLAVFGYVILTAFMLVAFFQSYRADQHAQDAVLVNCNNLNENRSIIRLVLEDANARTQTSKQRTAEEKRIANEFYSFHISKLGHLDCDKLAK